MSATDTVDREEAVEPRSVDRQHVFDCLRTHDTPISLADLADEIAVQENGLPITEISGEEIKRIYLSLYHSHLPELTDANVLTYSQERDLVGLSTNADSAAQLREDGA